MKLGDLGFGRFEFGPGETFHPFCDDLLEVVQVSLLNEHQVSERCVGFPSSLTWRAYVSMAAPASGLWRLGYLSPAPHSWRLFSFTWGRSYRSWALLKFCFGFSSLKISVASFGGKVLNLPVLWGL